jgi:hypothetical protein
MKPVLAGAIVLFFGLACVPGARADATVKLVAKGPLGDSNIVNYIKGTRMRSETTFGGRQMISIIDATAKQMVVLDPGTREATTYDLTKIAEQIQKTTKPEDTKVSFAPTGETKELLGRQCARYNLTLTMSVAMGGTPMKVTIGGPVWLAKDAPGSQDWTRFYKTAGDNGLFFGGPGGGGAEARSQALMYKTLAEAGGMPYEQEIHVKTEGGPKPAPEMPTVIMTVTEVTTDPISDDKFQIPAGYTRRNQ